ncbi:MAG: phosphotransferase, partial [Proteobacteria bacterium]|nr:phosphotransferase [Pseudomonadota bacterium]
MDQSAHPYSRLTPEKVLAAVESLNYKTDARIFALNSYENRVYQIGLLDAPPIIVKFYRPDRWNNQQILEEHAYTHELSDLEIPVVAPLPFSEQCTYIQFDVFQ